MAELAEPSDDFELPWRRRASAPPPAALHVVIVWSLEEPERVGHAAALVDGALIGRGEPEADETERRLQFKPSRASAGVPEWLEASRLSRLQLRFRDVTADTVR